MTQRPLTGQRPAVQRRAKRAGPHGTAQRSSTGGCARRVGRAPLPRGAPSARSWKGRERWRPHTRAPGSDGAAQYGSQCWPPAASSRRASGQATRQPRRDLCPVRCLARLASHTQPVAARSHWRFSCSLTTRCVVGVGPLRRSRFDTNDAEGQPGAKTTQTCKSQACLV